MTNYKDLLPTTLATTRLVLATPTHNDVQAITRGCNNANVHRWMARLPFPYGEDDARFFLDTIVGSDGEHVLGLYLNDTLIGVASIRFEPGQEPELGYWLAEDHWGQGLMSEAATALVDAAAKTGMPALKSRAHVDNMASRKLLKKLGFVEVDSGLEVDGNLAGQPIVFMRLELIR